MRTKGTKVTEQNMMAVMGRINKFLSKPTDFHSRRGAVENYNGICTVHPYRKELIEMNRTLEPADYLYKQNKVSIKNLLLLIEDRGVCGNVPIMANSRVFISGDCMVITNADATSVYYDLKERRVKMMELMGRNTKSTFVRSSVGQAEVDDVAVRNMLRKAFSTSCENRYFISKDDMEYGDMRGFNEFMMHLCDEVEQAICDIDVSADAADAELSIELDGEEVPAITLHFNIANIRQDSFDQSSECISFIYDGRTYGDAAQLAVDVVDDSYIGFGRE